MKPSSAVETLPAPPRCETETLLPGRQPLRLSWLLKWGAKGSLAVTDQALFSGAQFVLNILLARWLAPEGYGAFAVAYSVYLLAVVAHSALLVEPMIVFGSGKYLEVPGKYFEKVVRGHWLLTLPTGLTLLGAGALVGQIYSQPVGHALSALGLVLPLTLLAELTRRAFYVEMRPGNAATGGAVYFCALLVIAGGLREGRVLTPSAAILAMGTAALLTAALQFVWLRSRWPRMSAELSLKEVVSEHWRYGRWALASYLAAWASWNAYYLTLPLLFGLSAAGTLKALLNLIAPATQSLTALGILTLPLLARYQQECQLGLLRRTIGRVTSLFAGAAVLHLIILWIFRVQIIDLLYGGKYLEYSGLPVLLIGLVPLATACSVALGSALRACLRPDAVFWGYLAASAAALSLGLWWAASWGIVGALSGYLVSYVILAGVLWFFYKRLGVHGAVA